MAGSNSIDRNKLQKVETPYGNGYYYNGKLYSDQEFESLENSFKDGGNKTPKPGDPGYAPNKQNRDYTVSAPAKKPSDQEFTQFVEPEDPNPEPPGYIISQGNAPAGNQLPKGFNQSHIDMIYANPSTNQFQIQAFENQYGSGFRPGSKSVPATQYDAQSGQAQTPSLANMMDENAQPYTSEYGAYGDVVQRGGDVAEGVSLEGGKVTYENPIYENALRGNWTGENVATEVMPDKRQPSQAQPAANATVQPQIGAPAAAAKPAQGKPAQAKAAPNKPSAAPSLLDQQSSNYTPFFSPQEQTAQYSNYFTSKQSALDNPTSNQFRGTSVPTNRPVPQQRKATGNYANYQGKPYDTFIKDGMNYIEVPGVGLINASKLGGVFPKSLQGKK